METKILNLTPHAINFCSSDGTVILTVESSGLARVACKTVTKGEINGIPVTENEYSEIEDLPAPQKDTIYLVSALVAGRCKDRKDVFIPNELVRDEKGNIVGCRSLGRI